MIRYVLIFTAVFALYWYGILSQALILFLLVTVCALAHNLDELDKRIKRLELEARASGSGFYGKKTTDV